jgi:metabolite-proton symporter
MATSSSQMKRVAVASAIGTVIEFYDFTIFGIAAALVFNKVFFPALGGAAGTAVALATFGVAFVIRPFGAILFGHFGDRLGRKNTLVATLLLMGIATVGIGLLPTAQAIGPWAAVLLVILRCVQGLAMGGEWAGATVITAESAPKGRRGHYGMYPQLGPALGFLLSSATFLLTSLTMSDADFLSWGWRVPFLASAVLIVVGFVARMALEEPQEFKSNVHEAPKQTVRKLPVAELFREQTREVALATGATIAVFGLFYFVIVYLASYATQTLKFAKTDVLLIGMAGGVSLAITTVVGAMWSDRVGRRKVLAIGNGLCLVATLLLFPLLGLGGTAAFLLGVVVLQAGIGLAYGPLGAYLPELFSARYRYTGAGLAYNFGTVLGGALTPIIASQLIERYGPYSVGLYTAALCAISLWALALSKETLPNARTESAVTHAPGTSASSL